MSLTARVPESGYQSTKDTKDTKDKTDANSLYNVGSEAHDEDPHGFSKVVNTVDDDHAPSEVSRLLSGGREDGDSKKLQEKEASKKKLYSWLIKFGILSCVLVTLVAGIAVLAVYLTNHRGNILVGCVNEDLYDAQIDYFPDKHNSLNSDMEVVYYKHYKTVRIRNGQRFVLYQCGTPVPTGYASSRYFPVPVEDTATNRQTPISFVELVTKRKSVKYFGEKDTIVSSCPQKMLQQGEAQELSPTAEVRDEQLKEVDIVFSGSELGVDKCATYVFGAVDHPKDRAVVWVQFTGLFFNQELLANELAAKIANPYDCHKTKVQNKPKRDTVAWIDYTTTGSTETWYVSNDESELSYIRDAAGLTKSAIRSSYSNVADFHQALINATVVIDKSTYTTHWELFQDIYHLNSTSDYPFIRDKRIWRVDKLQNTMGSSDWIEGALAQPQAVLEDIISILHPDYEPNHQRRWLRDMFNDADHIVYQSASDCSNTNSELPILGSTCNLDD